MVNRRADWSTSAFDLPPVVPDSGPFPFRGFLETLWNHAPSGELYLAESGTALVPLVVDKTSLRWVGHPDLVDYRSPLGDAVPDLIAETMAMSPGRHFLFDSLPAEAAAVVGLGLEKAGWGGRPEQHAVTARLQLPDSYEAYLHEIGRKQRHEIRRKRRRFEESHGPASLVTSRGTGEAFPHFIGMHRSSPGRKGLFMTAAMEQLFASLADQPGWQVDVLRGADGAPVAATFSWVDREGFFLYNSAYDQNLDSSPGIVLLSMLIEQAIETGRRTFDFLKGDEAYKFRMGAVARPLFKFEGAT